ncbi:Peptidase A1 domain-containing protein [Mycena chlorophos]|uniref:Peptidase A1 domain-containing protein n=1 Tax=Mycena chlorophos TaxID=658473 RepID=A0A8H6SLB2_MYCCL|nr:Peptidase A1 domain-containing protein [Mycena chlorophos]
MSSFSSPIFARQDLTKATDTITVQDYGYVPSEPVAIVLIALFGLSTLLHTAQAFYFRSWFMLPTAVLCGVIELLGWAARLWSSLSGTADTAFKIQITATIIAPTPLLAANFTIFSRIIRELGPQYSLLPPRWYARIFVSCDIIALVVQGFGGASAASATTLDAANQGADIMLGGISFQFAVMIAFSLLIIDYLIRHRLDKPWRRPSTTSPLSFSRRARTPPITTMLISLALCTALLFIRAVYRLVELSGGWDGPIIRTQVYFNVFDGGMITAALWVWNAVHPGWFLPAGERDDGEGKGKGYEHGRAASMTSLELLGKGQSQAEEAVAV